MLNEIHISKQIDYKYLMMLNSWSCKDAALIICGFDPDNYRHVRFSAKHINLSKNSELIPAYKLYKVFESVNQTRSYHNRLSYPLSYINECIKKDWPVANELLNYIQEEQRENSIQKGNEVKDSTLKALAAMVMLYVSEKKSSELGTLQKINVSRLVERLLQFLEDHNLSVHGLGKSSLNEKIAHALRILERSKE